MKKLYKKELFYTLFFFLVTAIVLFFPVLHRSFASDDFLVLKRVALDRIILIKGFFRPLSDITLYFNYWIGGFNPVGYYLFNIILHGINSFLLFLFLNDVNTFHAGRFGGWLTSDGFVEHT